MSHCPGTSERRMSAWLKVTWEAGRWLWRRFLRARERAAGEESMPWIWVWRWGGWRDRREERRRAMQAVPVQRSRMRRGEWGRRRWARWRV